MAGHKPGRSSGFTLVELLVVVAIIAVLMSLGFVGVSSVRRRAAIAEGQAVQRTIGQAIIQYAQDHRGELPGPLTPSTMITRGSTPLGTGQTLVNRIGAYLGAEAVEPGEIVPAFANKAVLRKTDGDPSIPHYWMFFNLRAENGRFWGPCPWGYPGHPSYPSPIRIIAVNDPANQIVLKDNDRRLINTDRPRGWPGPGGLSEPIYGISRNVLYFDGHVEEEPLSAVQLD
jgi:prepilin-type N-terminal cleavage/methylation domain-containing protein/prepilin-type processing-associated H-X9-DG protein